MNDQQLSQRIDDLSRLNAAEVGCRVNELLPLLQELQRRRAGWIAVAQKPPEFCQMVIGYAPDWMDADYNPRGFRECFLMDDGHWISVAWNNYSDSWESDDDETAPTHWWLPETPPC